MKRKLFFVCEDDNGSIFFFQFAAGVSFTPELFNQDMGGRGTVFLWIDHIGRFRAS